jgi:hypothetical protein
MKNLSRAQRPRGRARWASPGSVVAALAVLLASTPPIAAVEIPYLMNGKAGAFRVLINRTDHSNANVTIDFGPQSETALNAGGFLREVKFSAKLEDDRFVVRDPELTRLVTSVATMFVKAVAFMFVPPEVEVLDATMAFKPVEWHLEGTFKVHITTKPPNGAVSNFLNETFEFVGTPIPMDAEEANRKLMATYDAYIPYPRRTATVRQRITYANKVAWEAALRAGGEDPAKHPDLQGYTNTRVTPPVIAIREGALPATVAHELVHMYANPEMAQLFGHELEEGLTNHLAREAVKSPQTGESDLDLAYPAQTLLAKALTDDVGRDVVARAYFGSDLAALNGLGAAFDRKHGAGRFLDVLMLIQSGNLGGALALIQGR